MIRSRLGDARGACAVLALAAVASCGDDLAPPTATVWRTSYGVPHIVARDLYGLALGQGYAFAEDHVCLLTDQVIKLRGERAKYLGPGPGGAYAGSDLVYRMLDLYGRAREAFPRQPPDVQAVLRGYAEGFNRYLAETRPADRPRFCAEAEWVQPIDEIDLQAHVISLAITGGTFPYLPFVLAAHPPGTAAPAGAPQPPLALPQRPPIGSNGWVIGAERSASGRGMLLANPHFPWEGELRLWESHLMIPGELNAYGVSLLGVPALQIGFTDELAWTHTVTHGAQLTVYALRLVPGQPTRYYYDGQERAMEPREVEIDVRQPDGSLQRVRRTFWASHHGPILSLPGFEWSPTLALAIKDPNLDNTSVMEQYLGMLRAKSLPEFQEVFARVQGIPFINTLAVDRQGTAWYVNSSSTPNLSDAVNRQWEQTVRDPTPTLPRIFYHELPVPLWLLDGSTAQTEWQLEPGARVPGVIPYARAPQQTRRDFLFNANNPHWIANPAAPLVGYSPQYGLEHEPISPRARLNAVMLSEIREGGASGADGKFTREELEAAAFSNRSYTAELLRADVVARCRGRTQGTHAGEVVDIRRACAALESWDGRYHAESVGAIVWRELLGTYAYLDDVLAGGALYATPFSGADPVGTPRGLKPAPAAGRDPLLDRLATAVVRLRDAGLAPETPLGQAQYFPRSGRPVPIHGGIERDATLAFAVWEPFNTSLQPTTPQGELVHPATGLSRTGYVVNTGNTFMLTLEYTDRGVDAAALLVYGESEDPRSPHYNDQLGLYVDRKLRPVRFTLDEVMGEPSARARELR
jgi:acyl-homoserine-lactone acylase